MLEPQSFGEKIKEIIHEKGKKIVIGTICVLSAAITIATTAYLLSPVPIETETDIFVTVVARDTLNDIRQYADTGRVEGYNACLDLNLFYENIPQYIIENGLNHTEEMKEKDKPKMRIIKIYEDLFNKN